MTEDDKLKFANNFILLKKYLDHPLIVDKEKYLEDLINVLELLKQKEIFNQENFDAIMIHYEFLQRFASKISDIKIHSQIKNQKSFNTTYQKTKIARG